ncbi:MAG TPA: NAD-dependent epimerase/dehydratase family protein [Pirellulales bacterium]|nr:NAD-dependent epimerase/dehydratase family protein [Pirellulales bacterium]
MKALITGITGFAGGFLAEHLLACGDEVLGCSRSGRWPAWAGAELRRLGLLACDVGDAAGITDQARQQIARFTPDCIYHLAALSVPADCGTIEPAGRAIEVNVGGTSRVLELASDLARKPRVVFISTSHVYGAATEQHHLLDEATPAAPRRAYGKTKWLAEQVATRARSEQGLDVLVVRSFQHSGPRQEPRLMLPEWTAQFVGGEEAVRVKHLNTWIDLSDVRDVVRAYRLLAEQGEQNGVYNVGSGVARRTGGILDVLRRLAGPDREIIEQQPGDERWDPIADIRRLQAATGWRPEIELETTVRDTLDYWRQAAVRRG